MSERIHRKEWPGGDLSHAALVLLSENRGEAHGALLERLATAANNRRLEMQIRLGF
jgi:hypothetical protein